MTTATKLFHNPRCSKSRQTLQLLESKDFRPDIVEYLKQPPTAQELEQILDLLGLEPRELMRTHEKPYSDNKLDDPGLSRDELIRAMIEHPILIQRPILIHNGKAVIGRPPAKVLDIV